MKADLSLLRPATQEAYDAEPFAAPYLADFRRGAKRLIFLAADHETGPDTPTAKTVARVFQDMEPRIVVVEGIDSHPASARWFRARVLEQAAAGCATCEESEYAASLAFGRGIPVLGGEPPDRLLLQALMKEKYSARDFLGYSLARQIPIWKRLGWIETHGLEALSEHLLKYVRNETGATTRFDYADFILWLKGPGGWDRPPLDLTPDETAPLGLAEPIPLQRLAHVVDRTREATIVRRVASALTRRGRVFVVYGSGHYVKQRGVWENLFGPAEHSKPF
jgi:hypothetical protein